MRSLARIWRSPGAWIASRSGSHNRLGRRGERVARGWLRKSGYRILGSNLLTNAGEADLLCVAPDGLTIVLVEVKTRIASGGPRPEDAVGARKRATLRAVMQTLARANGWERSPRRIDVLAVEFPAGGRGKPAVRHHPAAVTDR